MSRCLIPSFDYGDKLPPIFTDVYPNIGFEEEERKNYSRSRIHKTINGVDALGRLEELSALTATVFGYRILDSERFDRGSKPAIFRG